MFTIYNSPLSGNCYKIRLLCALLNIECQWIETDILKQESRTPEFLAINPLGQVPVLVNDDNSQVLTESNAILFYLAQHTALIPSDGFDQAKMWQWLIFEQADVRHNMASIRFIKKFQNMPTERLEEYRIKFEKAKDVLDYLNEHLTQRPFFLGEQMSIADIAIYAYTHVVDEGGIDLTAYSNLQHWFKRIENLPNYIGLTQQPI